MLEETPQLPVSPQETQIQAPSLWEKIQAQKKKILIELGVFIVVLILAGAVFGVYKYSQRQIPIEPTEGPTPTLVATPTPDPTADWETYTNTKYGFSIRYPKNYTSQEYGPSGPSSIQVQLKSTEAGIDINIFWLGESPAYNMSLTEWYNDLLTAEMPYTSYGAQSSPEYTERKEIEVGGVKGIQLKQMEEYGGLADILLPIPNAVVEIAIDDVVIETPEIQLILSTFKFLEEEGTSPTPTPITQNYPRPSSWKTITISSLKISLCLPPKWEWETDASGYGHIVFNRDPAYKPNVAWINFFDYKGGSRREEYINLKVQYEYEPDKLRNETKVDEFSINGQSVLKIAIPSFPEAIVFVLDNKLYEVSLASWNLVNDSQSAFLKDIYTMVGCIQPI